MTAETCKTTLQFNQVECLSTVLSTSWNPKGLLDLYIFGCLYFIPCFFFFGVDKNLEVLPKVLNMYIDK